jgi:hypothetical protein
MSMLHIFCKPVCKLLSAVKSNCEYFMEQIGIGIGIQVCSVLVSVCFLTLLENGWIVGITCHA